MEEVDIDIVYSKYRPVSNVNMYIVIHLACTNKPISYKYNNGDNDFILYGDRKHTTARVPSYPQGPDSSILFR